jgi:hypothetical protein
MTVDEQRGIYMPIAGPAANYWAAIGPAAICS